MKYALLIAAMVSTSVEAQERLVPSIYGITINEPIPLAECGADAKAVERYRKAKAKNPDMAFLRYPYGVNRTGPCYKRAEGKAGSDLPLVDEGLSIDFPMSSLPEGAKWDGVWATIIDGKVQGVGFMTYGLTSQEVVFNQLQGKFGPPTVNKIVAKQNGFGAKFSSIEAGWSFDDGIMASFEGTGFRTDYGNVRIQTAEARRRSEESLRKIAGQSTPM